MAIKINTICCWNCTEHDLNKAIVDQLSNFYFFKDVCSLNSYFLCFFIFLWSIKMATKRLRIARCTLYPYKLTGMIYCQTIKKIGIRFLEKSRNCLTAIKCYSYICLFTPDLQQKTDRPTFSTQYCGRTGFN